MSPSTRGLRVAYLASVSLALASCASPPPPPEPAVVELSIDGFGCEALGLGNVRVSGRIVVAVDGAVLDGSEPCLESGAVAYRCALGSAVAEGRAEREVGEVARATTDSSGASSYPFSLELSLPEGREPLLPLELSATLAYVDRDGSARSAAASASLEVPRVMAPTLTVSSIRILKDELINTKLRVDLAVDNPNAFPLTFSALDYRLYGEGRYWASDSLAKAFTVPELGSATASLYLTMNFSDMSRSLLDQVIRLAAVSYRLEGRGRVATGLAFLPEFSLPFDLSGRVGVTR